MLRQLLGWWLFDTERVAITHATTGQCLSYLGLAVREETDCFTESVNRRWMRFDYEDDEQRCPLLVEWRNVPSKSAGRPLVWRVDYVHSMRLWKQVVNTHTPNPPYDLWRRIDNFLTDALACWPSHPKTSTYPSHISFRGGWLNGKWTSELYRSVAHSDPQMREIKSLHEHVTAPSAGPPSPWVLAPHMAAIPEQLKELGRVMRDEDWQEVEAALRHQFYLTTGDYSRLLVALPVKKEIRANLKSINRLFYADDDIVTDTLHAGVRDVGHQPSNWTIMFEKKTSIGLSDRNTGNPIPWVSSTHVYGSVTVQAEYIPHAIGLRLTHACLDAWLTYPDASWMALATEGAEKPAMPPETIYIGDWTVAGTNMPAPMQAALLPMNTHSQPNPLAYMFDEENEGISRQSSPYKTEGCWNFDPASHTLVNELSQQRVRFCETIDEHDPKIPNTYKIWRFHYQDAETAYPLIVRCQVKEGRGRLHYTWVLDHEKSATLQRQAEPRDTEPAYGLWQRVDECMVDALLCWPELEITGPKPYCIMSSAGWYNGAWSHRIRRSRYRGDDHGFVEEDAPPRTPLFASAERCRSCVAFYRCSARCGQCRIGKYRGD